MPEFDLIDLIARRAGAIRGDVAIGIGDDAAVLDLARGERLVACVDTLVAGVHFPDGTAPADLGWKALAVNLSDLAAMGAEPRFALLALTLPDDDPAFVRAFAAAFAALARRHGVALVGGDTTRGPLSISVTALGALPRGAALRRDGARIGDAVWTSGTLGDAAAGLAWLDGRIGAAAPRDAKALRHRLDRPEPRVTLGLALRGLASAAIDVSDGFAQDLVHVLESSGVRATVNEPALPGYAGLAAPGIATELARRCLLAGGDDYELVFTAPPARRGEVEAIGRELGLALARVGTIERGAPALTVLDAEGRPVPLPRGYDHFGNSPP